LPDNTLCDVTAQTPASIAQLLEEVSAAELAALKFDMSDDADETVAAIQQTGNKAAARQAARARKTARRNAKRNGKLRNCGLCRTGTCVAQTGKVCRTARPRPAQ
jgi:membrane protease subunit (stomatin/prohibitin family)